MIDKINFGSLSAYTKKKTGDIYMVLSEGGKETIIDQGNANYDLGVTANFYPLGFSATGNYLLYRMSLHEGAVSYVYDIKNKKTVFNSSAYPETGFGFTPDEKYFYACAEGGMGSSDEGGVYNVPDFKVVYDALGIIDTAGTYCRYDLKIDSVIFYYMSDTVRYSLKEQKEYMLD